MEGGRTALLQPSFLGAAGLALARCQCHDLEEVVVALEGSLEEEEVAAVVEVLAAGASTALVVPRGFPSVLEAASGVLLEVVDLAWEVAAVVALVLVVVEGVVALDLVLVVVEVAVALDLVLVEAEVVVVAMALVEVLVGLALVEQEAWGDLEGWVVAGLPWGLVALLAWAPSKK